MREIKFRAWNLLAKKMMSHEDICYTPNLKMYELFCDTPDNRPWELMQYTGLKDKNGVEIYEGDIIDIGYEKGVIVWYQLDAMFAYAPLTISIEATHKGKTAYQVVLDGGSPVELDFVREFVTNKDCSKGEVIGNIYENPELLEDK